MKLKKWIWLPLLISLILISIGCSFGNGSNEKVRVAEVTRSIFYAPLYAAMAQGYFEEEGIDLELTTAWGGDKTMTALLSDGADIALVGAETSIYVYAQNASDPVINFAGLTQTDGTFLVAREPTDEFHWDDLKGSTFLGQRKGGMPQMVGEHVLRQHGIDPRKDLNLLQHIDFGNIPSAFASGTGDYVQLFEPQATLFENEGLGHIVASFGEESGEVPYTVFMTKESTLTNNNEMIERFTRALYKGQQWVSEQPPEIIAATIVTFFEDTPVDVVTQVVERYKEQGSYATDPFLSSGAWDNLQTIMDASGELPLYVEYEELVNTQIAESIVE